jgi:FtsH-binding integral membrane protein
MATFFLMGLIALIVGSVVNIFLASSAFDWALTVVGVLLFAGLTVYDIQMFKKRGYLGFSTKKEAGQMAIFGALNLYLDFINMFIYLLRLFGDRR